MEKVAPFITHSKFRTITVRVKDAVDEIILLYFGLKLPSYKSMLSHPSSSPFHVVLASVFCEFQPSSTVNMRPGGLGRREIDDWVKIKILPSSSPSRPSDSRFHGQS